MTGSNPLLGFFRSVSVSLKNTTPLHDLHNLLEGGLVDTNLENLPQFEGNDDPAKIPLIVSEFIFRVMILK